MSGMVTLANNYDENKMNEYRWRFLKTVGPLRLSLVGMNAVPLAVISYIYIQYIYPMFASSGQEEMALGISAVLILSAVLSVLGLAILSRSASDSLAALGTLNERMDSILQVTKRFQETGYVDTLLDSVACSASDLLGAEASSLLLYDDDGNLRFEYVEGAASRFLKGKVVQPGEGITGWAAQERKPVIINDVQADPRFSIAFDKSSGFVTRSIICVPLIFAGRDVGVLEALNKKASGGFTEEDEHILVSLAEHASAAIYKNITYEEMKVDFVQILDVLITAMDNHMPKKKGHARRVARYAVRLAKELGLDEEEIRRVYFGAILHDIGLLKFDSNEYGDKGRFNLHPSLGADIVKNIAQWKDVAPIIRDHHERFDGTGYPSGLKGSEISLGGRIVAVSEAFDVMIGPNSYKSAISFEDAMEEIRALAGYQFDPQISEVFLKSFRKELLEDTP